MLKNIVFGVVAVAAATQVSAAEISTDTLAAMGLGDAVVVSDAVAAEVRGLGFEPTGGRRIRQLVSSASAFGASFAQVAGEQDAAVAGSENGFEASGRFSAAGDNLSEAGITTVRTESVDVGGVITTNTITRSVTVFAGGLSSSSAF